MFMLYRRIHTKLERETDLAEELRIRDGTRFSIVVQWVERRKAKSALSSYVPRRTHISSSRDE